MADEPAEKLVLKPGQLTQYLSNFSQNENCEVYCFTDLILCNRRVEALAKTMDELKEVRKCDLSLNNIVDITPLKDMQQLQWLNLSKNKIKAVNIFCTEDMFPNLKWLDISYIKISELPPIKLPKLEYLDIGYNKLEKVNDGWTGHPNLRVLKSVDNKFKSLSQLKALPKLEELYLAANALTTLGGWDGMPMVRVMHLRRNKIEKFEKIEEGEEIKPLEQLEKINLRANKISSFETLEKLMKNEKLFDINILNNPLETQASSFNMLVSELLMRNPKMKRFCKHQIDERNQLEAVYLKQFKWNKKEEARKKLLAEEAAKAAKEAD